MAVVVFTCAPGVSAHGALTINEFDTYAISDFEAHEDSFAWEGFEIWDVYAGDGYDQAHAAHGVYFKANFAGDGTVRPAGGQTWEVRFDFSVGGQDLTRSIMHDGAKVTTDFEALEWQIADGNVLQVHAWTPVPAWQGLDISNLVVRSYVDGDIRDTAPGGIHLPGTGTEVPVHVPATPIFPEMGEGRIVERVALTGAAKFLNVSMARHGEGLFQFTITNALAQQGQHFMFHAAPTSGWTLEGKPAPVSIDGGESMTFQLRLHADRNHSIEPLRLELMTDIGGMQSYFAFVGEAGVEIVDDAALAVPAGVEEPAVATPAWTPALLGVSLAMAALRRRDGR